MSTVSEDLAVAGMTTARAIGYIAKLHRELKVTRELLRDREEHEGDTECPHCGQYTLNKDN